jgi:hypothetical protein
MVPVGEQRARALPARVDEHVEVPDVLGVLVRADDETIGATYLDSAHRHCPHRPPVLGGARGPGTEHLVGPDRVQLLEVIDQASHLPESASDTCVEISPSWLRRPGSMVREWLASAPQACAGDRCDAAGASTRPLLGPRACLAPRQVDLCRCTEKLRRERNDHDGYQ